MAIRLPVLQGEVPTIKGNSKLQKSVKYRIIGFGTPADTQYIDEDGNERNTCEQAQACRAVCYAKQGRYVGPNVVNARTRALQHTFSPSFVDDMVKTLRKSRVYNVVRIHDSGDFLSQKNYEQWKEIARRMPEKIFYAYTKRLDLDLWTDLPSNLRITQSIGGKLDHLIDYTKPHARIFSSVEAREMHGYVDGNVNDDAAIDGILKIGLVYHGVRKLTKAQHSYFSRGD